MTQISNNWITMSTQRSGVDVQRKFAGLLTECDVDNNILYCDLYYWERELYPNGDVNKLVKKYYTVKDLTGLPILSGFISAFAQNAIINQSRLTIADLTVLPLDIQNGYVLKSQTFI